MPKWLIGLLVLWIPLMVAGVVWYQSEAQVAKRAFAKANDELNTATETKNVPALTQFLQAKLTEKAKVLLKVEHTMLGVRSNTVLMSQEFSKPEFIRFMDLTLEPIESSTLRTTIEGMVKNADGSYAINTYAAGSGKGPEHMQGMRIPMTYTVQMRCNSTAHYANEAVQVERMECSIGLGQRADSATPVDLQQMIKRATE